MRNEKVNNNNWLEKSEKSIESVMLIAVPVTTCDLFKKMPKGLIRTVCNVPLTAVLIVNSRTLCIT